MKRSNYSIAISSLSFLLLLLGLLAAKNKEIISPVEPIKGEKLAIQYCSSCHNFPDPSLLDKATWKDKVLVNMGWRLGIRDEKKNPFQDMQPAEGAIVKELHVYPELPIISKEEWKLIVDYYLQKAPSKAIQPQQNFPQGKGIEQFEASPILIGEKRMPRTSMIKYDKRDSLLYIGDADNDLFIINPSLEASGYWKLASAPVDIQFRKDQSPLLLCIGDINPSEEKKGALFPLDSTESIEARSKPIAGLGRPVQFVLSDLNQNGTEDIVVAEFGHHTGKLSWFENGDAEKKRVIKYQAGIRKIIVEDVNQDKRPDFYVLCAQAYESILLFINQGNGKFEEKTLLQFPPVYGLSHFEMHDFNKDGFNDILLSNGDNWDYSPIRKAYHGVRIFLNDKKNNFKEQFFFPLFGASKAMACDFDKDGDLDIAAASFYDDPENPEEGFVYLENRGELNFSRSTFSDGAKGKWLTMEIADLNKDGLEEIILGSYFHNILELTKMYAHNISEFPIGLILWNKNKPTKR